MENFYSVNAVELNKDINRFMDKLELVYKEFGNDGLIEYAYGLTELIKKNSGLNDMVTCSKQKCSFCCHSTIYLSNGEKDYIQKRIRQNGIKPDKRRSKLQNTVRMNQDNESSVKWVDRACPFLSKTDGTGDCTIYEIRPLVCRNHNSTAKDFNECNREDDYNRTITDARVIELEAINIAVMKLTEREEPIIPIYKVI